MIVNRHEKAKFLYTDVNKIYSAIGKESPNILEEDEEGDKKDFTYKNSVRRKELLIGLEPVQNRGVFTPKEIDDTSEICYTSWRKESYNQFGDVEPQIGFFPEKFDIEPSVKIQNGESSDLLEKFNNIRDKAFKEWDVLRYLAINPEKKSTLSNIAMASTIREFGVFNTFKSVEKLITAVKVDIPFSYGQFGLFNAYEEVVKPVCALMSLFSPKKTKSTSADGSIELYNTPYPTDAYLTSQQLKSLVGTTTETIIDALFSKKEESSEGDGSSGDSKNVKTKDVDFLNQSLQTIEQVAISGILKVLNQTGPGKTQWKFATLRYGNFKISPCQVVNISSKFDFKHLDENGYPYKCVVSFNAEGLTNATNDTIIDAFLK